MFIWVLTGSVWLFDDMQGCEDGKFYLDFGDGYRLTLSMLLVYYIILGLIVIFFILITVITCIGSSKLEKFIQEDNDKDDSYDSL